MKQVTIPLPRVPTDDELKEATRGSWEAVEPVLLSRLHPEIMRLTMPTRFVTVPTAEIVERWLPGFDGRGDAHQALLAEGRKALDEFPEGFFFKLDSRSPKDAGIARYTAENLEEVPHDFFCSMRMLDDLCGQRLHRDTFILCFREWVELRDEQRVFVKGGRVQGGSRYDYREETEGYAPERIARIERDAAFYLSAIGPHLPIRDYVFDFGYLPSGEAILIELNPYGLSDPCCFGSYDRIAGYAWRVTS